MFGRLPRILYLSDAGAFDAQAILAFFELDKLRFMLRVEYDGDDLFVSESQEAFCDIALLPQQFRIDHRRVNILVAIVILKQFRHILSRCAGNKC